MLMANVGVSLANTDLHMAKEEEKQASNMRLSFEKQLQSERTLKIQVGVIDPPPHHFLPVNNTLESMKEKKDKNNNIQVHSYLA